MQSGRQLGCGSMSGFHHHCYNAWSQWQAVQGRRTIAEQQHIIKDVKHLWRGLQQGHEAGGLQTDLLSGKDNTRMHRSKLTQGRGRSTGLPHLTAVSCVQCDPKWQPPSPGPCGPCCGWP